MVNVPEYVNTEEQESFYQATQSAKNWWYEQAQKGNPNAQFELARMYHKAIDVEMDNEKAVFWLTEAAKQGHSGAVFELSQKYGSGSGVKKDLKNAEYLLQSAVEMGNSEALTLLGWQYLRGSNRKQNIEKGVRLLGEAAEKGDSEAQLELAKFMMEEKEYEHAAGLFSAAAQQGDADAQYELGLMFFNGIGVQKDQNIAINLWEESAKKNHEASQQTLNKIYAQREQLNKAKKAYDKVQQQANKIRTAAEQGDSTAQHELGLLFLECREDQEALVWFEKSARQGNINAQYTLGTLCLNGIGRNTPSEGIKWLKLAAKQGHKKAIDSLRRM